MSERRDVRLFLEDIMDSILAIMSFTEGMEQDDFKNDRKTVSATIYELEVIGEAVSNIPDNLKQDYPDVLWREIRAFRNKLVHKYFGIHIKIVWDVVINELPVLKNQIEQIIIDLN